MPKKQGLGRGLESLLGDAVAESKRSADDKGVIEGAQLLKLSDIHPNPNQPRKNFIDSELEELKVSIQSVGVLQPLLVRKDETGYEIIAGERRYQASLRAGLKEVPAIVKEVTGEEQLVIALVENLQRSDLNPIEEAIGYKRLIDLSGLTQDKLAKTISKSRSSIANALRLLDLPEKVQQFLYEGKLSAGHARAILVVPNEDKRVSFAEKIVEDQLSVREAERLAPLFSQDGTQHKPRVATPKSFKVAAKKLRQKLSTSVRVKTVGGKNKIEIEFADEDELARILELLKADEKN